MSVLPHPISGGDELTNSAGITDLWSCPNCYADHRGHADGHEIECECGAKLRLHLDYEPVCRAEAIAFAPKAAA
jgi:hypothetical protein